MNLSPIHEPTLQDVLESAISTMIGQIHTAFPATIETYDETKALASVKPSLSRKYADGSVVDFPVIPCVPVLWPRTSRGSISFPLEKRDGVLIICSERSLDEWLSNGGIVAPEDKRRHSIIDGIAIPGLFSFKTNTKISGNLNFQINFENQTISITPDGSINVGASSLQKAMTEAYKTALETYLAAVQVFVNACAASVTDPVLAAAAGVFLAQYPAGFLSPVNGLTSKVTLE
jgi:hypothetical protein